jgi:hypothetical protein
MHARGAGTAALLKDVRENPAALLADPKKELRAFRVALTVPVGSKRGRGRGSFIDSVVDALNTFYPDVVQHLKAWSAAPPKMREPVELPTEAQPALVSTSLSSQDGSEPSDAPEDDDSESHGDQPVDSSRDVHDGEPRAGAAEADHEVENDLASVTTVDPR